MGENSINSQIIATEKKREKIFNKILILRITEFMKFI